VKKKTLGLLTVALLAGPAGATAANIDFESLASAGTGFAAVPSPYAQAGYQLTSAFQSSFSFESAQSGNALWYAGSTGLLNGSAGATTTLTSLTGSVFDLYSIDLAPASVVTYGGGAQVQFIGNVFGGGTVSQTFTVGNALEFQTFLFSSFQNLTSVQWAQVGKYHQFDNICIGDAACSTDVPEPGTLALLGFGLAGLGLTRRRKT